MEFETIKNLYDAVKKGEVDEKKLSIFIDNDCTGFLFDDKEEIIVKKSYGLGDCETLYKILFPKACVGS